MNSKKNLKRKLIIYISMIMMMISIFIETREIFINEEINISYENIDIKNMAPAKVQIKEENKNIIDIIFEGLNNSKFFEEVAMLKKQSTDVAEKSEPKTEPPFVWKLPTEMGTISQYPSYYHTAFDITSSRAYNEPIYSIARGTISSIYTDNAGALIVTVLHNYNGVNITSQYVHLSRYADIYVGKQVTENDILGYMGSTGNSTGPHLHLTVIDCGLYVPGDNSCYDLNSFYNFQRRRYNEGMHGLSNYMQVPYSWNSR